MDSIPLSLRGDACGDAPARVITVVSSAPRVRIASSSLQQLQEQQEQMNAALAVTFVTKIWNGATKILEDTLQLQLSDGRRCSPRCVVMLPLQYAAVRGLAESALALRSTMTQAEQIAAKAGASAAALLVATTIVDVVLPRSNGAPLLSRAAALIAAGTAPVGVAVSGAAALNACLEVGDVNGFWAQFGSLSVRRVETLAIALIARPADAAHPATSALLRTLLRASGAHVQRASLACELLAIGPVGLSDDVIAAVLATVASKTGSAAEAADSDESDTSCSASHDV